MLRLRRTKQDIFPMATRAKWTEKFTKGTFPLTIEIEGEEVKLLCDFTFYPHIPAQTSGPVEGCYPEEPEIVEFENLRVDSELCESVDFLRDILSPSFEEALDKCWREWCEERSK